MGLQWEPKQVFKSLLVLANSPTYRFRERECVSERNSASERNSGSDEWRDNLRGGSQPHHEASDVVPHALIQRDYKRRPHAGRVQLDLNGTC